MGEVGEFVGKIKLKLDGKGADEASKSMGKLKSEGGLVNKITNRLVFTFGDLMNVLKKLSDSFFSLVEIAGKQELAEKRLADAMKAQGIFTEKAFQANLKYASSLQKITKFGDETIIETQQLLTTFGLQGEKLDETTEATLNLAAALGIDLKAAGILLGKAFAGETGSLSRYGIIIDANIPKSEKFAEVLKQLKERFSGVATGEVDTMLGKMKQFSNEVGDLKEKIGEELFPVFDFWIDKLKAITGFLDKLASVERKHAKVSQTTMQDRLAGLELEKISIKERIKVLEKTKAAGLKSNTEEREQLKNKLILIEKVSTFIRDKAIEEIKNRKKVSKEIKKLSVGEIANARAARVEKDNLAVAGNLKALKLRSTLASWTINKQQEALESLRATTIEGTKAYQQYTDALTELDQQRAQNFINFQNQLASSFSGSITMMLDGTKDFGDGMQSIWDDIRGFVLSALSQMIAKVIVLKGIMAGLNLIFPGLGGVLGNLLSFDSGGVIPGEIGKPRLVMAHAGETILPTHKTASSSSGMFGMRDRFNLTVNVPMGTSRSQAKQIGRMVGDEFYNRFKKNRKANRLTT